MKNEISLQKISARISLGMLLSTLVMGSAWSAEVTSLPTGTVKGNAPAMTAGQITSSLTTIGIGTVLSMKAAEGEWTFSDADGDTEKGTLYEWMVGNQVVSSGNDTSNKSYTIAGADLGKTFSLRVTPMTDPLTTDPSRGTAVVSKNTLSTINANTVTAVEITGYTGNPMVKSTLDVNLSCSGINGSGCGTKDTYDYQWQIQDRDALTGNGGDTYSDIINATSSTYEITKDRQKLKLKVKVKNKVSTTNTTAETAKAKAKVTQ